jgi:hypothetical protein
MGKDSKASVRSHLQERQWLIDLGNGNILEGVKQLLSQLKGEPWQKDNYSGSRKKR